MLAVIGDVHGEFQALRDVLEQLPDDVKEVLQVGDFGLWPVFPYPAMPRSLRWIRGNHEYEPAIRDLCVPTEVAPGCTFMPSGWIEQIDGRLIGFLGGGDSPDRDERLPGLDWWPTEAVTRDQVEQVCCLGPLDLLLTHVPPASVVRTWFGYSARPSELLVQEAWERTGFPRLVCGHQHMSLRYDQVTVLDMLEVVLL